MFRAQLLLLAACLVFSGSADAQVLSELRGGDRVRIWSSTASGQYTVVDVGEEVVTLQAASADVLIHVPFSSISRLDVHHGRRPPGARALRGAGFGLLIGAGIGAVGGFIDGDDDGRDFISFTAQEKALLLGVAFGGLGALVGGIAGLSSRGDRWERLAGIDEVRAGPGIGGGVAVVLSRRF